MTEQRREPRQNVSWPLRAAGISGVGEGRTINASLCGFLFASEVNFADRELLVLRIATDPNTLVNCVVQINREESRDGRMIHYGAELQYISAADRQRLSFALLVVQ